NRDTDPGRKQQDESAQVNPKCVHDADDSPACKSDASIQPIMLNGFQRWKGKAAPVAENRKFVCRARRPPSQSTWYEVQPGEFNHETRPDQLRLGPGRRSEERRVGKESRSRR